MIKSKVVRNTCLIMKNQEGIADTMYDLINQKSHLVGNQDIQRFKCTLYFGSESSEATVPKEFRATFIEDSYSEDDSMTSKLDKYHSPDAFLSRFQKVSCRLGDFVSRVEEKEFKDITEEIYKLSEENYNILCLSPGVIISILFEEGKMLGRDLINNRLHSMMLNEMKGDEERYKDINILKYDSEIFKSTHDKETIEDYIREHESDKIQILTDIPYHYVKETIDGKEIKDGKETKVEKIFDRSKYTILSYDGSNRKSIYKNKKEISETCTKIEKEISENLRTNKTNTMEEFTQKRTLVCILDMESAMQLTVHIKNRSTSLRCIIIVCIDSLDDRMNNDMGISHWDDWIVRAVKHK